MFGLKARYPRWANFRVISRYNSSHPGMWWITTIPGKGPGPRGRAKYALIMSPLNPWTVVVSASIPSYMSVVYRCIISVRDLWGGLRNRGTGWDYRFKSRTLRLKLPIGLTGNSRSRYRSTYGCDTRLY